MFPFESGDPTTQAIVAFILAVIRHIAEQAGTANDPAFAEIVGLRQFAGALFFDATTGLATAWAIAVDNLLDAILRVLGLDPLAVRGDH